MGGEQTVGSRVEKLSMKEHELVGKYKSETCYECGEVRHPRTNCKHKLSNPTLPDKI